VYDTNLTKAEIQKEINVVNAAVQQKIKDAACKFVYAFHQN
jgi:hypothetical protein